MDQFSILPEWAREKALARLELIRPALQKMSEGVSAQTAATWLLATAADGSLPSLPTLKRYLAKAAKGDLSELAPRGVGRIRRSGGWEARAQKLYASPQKRGYATVAYLLQKDGYADATESRVTTYLKSLPSNLTDTHPDRVGRKFWEQNIRPHYRRDPNAAEVGEIYVGDGHRCDVYVQHPSTGKAFRPELTVWMDWRSRKVVGWWLSEDESAINSLFGLSHAIRTYDHVPGWGHHDPGSGYKNEIHSNPVTGFYARLNIRERTTLPGNARGKGDIEQWNGSFEERFGKQWDTYCGHCRTDDLLSRLATKIKRGQLKLPSLEEYASQLTAYMAQYNAHPQRDSIKLQGASPDDLWATLERNPLGVSMESLLRPMREATVRKSEVTLFRSIYRAVELMAYEGRKVHVEYDLHDPEHVWIRDQQGRLIVIAARTGYTTQWAPLSVMEQQRVKSLEGKIARLQQHQDEAIARARGPITAEATLHALDSFDALALPPSLDEETEGLQPLDLHDTDY
ncbi:Mu transposase C-terminal domain-containing protein [Hydrocarboniphaga effusa]|uniref:Mu transposase C-terminal domain-containing protein n=1 Tax=Hydrocarboniphaga effusa TaxID=243629 RepID=UPI003BAC86FF